MENDVLQNNQQGLKSLVSKVVVAHIPGYQAFWFNKVGQDTLGCEIVGGDWSAFGRLPVFEHGFEQVMDWYGLLSIVE